MTELIADECVLTPEQRRCLGQVYRLILSWRREHSKGMQELSHVQLSTEPEQPKSDPVYPVESES
jgi:hypothetical protein